MYVEVCSLTVLLVHFHVGTNYEVLYIWLFHYFIISASALCWKPPRYVTILLSLVYKDTWTWLSQSICTYIVPISTPKDTSERLLLCCIYCTNFCRDDRWIGPSSSSAIAIAIAAGSEGATPIKITTTYVCLCTICKYITGVSSLVPSRRYRYNIVRYTLVNYTPNRHRASNLNPLTSTKNPKQNADATDVGQRKRNQSTNNTITYTRLPRQGSLLRSHH